MSRYPDKNQIIDYDEKYATVTAAVSADTEIVRFQVKPGKKAYLSFVGNAVDSAGVNSVTFILQVNRGNFYPFDGSLNQWAPPESNYDLPAPYEIPTGSEVRVIARNSSGSTTYSATARIRIIYTDF